MGLTQQSCDEILGKLETGITVEALAEEYLTSTGIIELVRIGKCRLTDNTQQNFINEPINVKMGEPVVRTKSTPEEIDEICERYKYGETLKELGKDFGLGTETVRLYLEKRGIQRGRYNTEGVIPGLRDFLRQVRKILFRYDRGPDKKSYNDWQGKTLELYQTGDYSKYECQVMAARKFECCRPLFDKFDVSAYDPMAKKGDVTGGNTPFPEGSQVAISENTIERLTSKKPVKNVIECEDKDLSYRENLSWAVKAVGSERRTGVPPETCPNDTAYWLYEQAKMEPKEFLAKLNAIEARNLGKEDESVGRRAAKRSIEDLDAMLAELTI